MHVYTFINIILNNTFPLIDTVIKSTKKNIIVVNTLSKEILAMPKITKLQVALFGLVISLFPIKGKHISFLEWWKANEASSKD